MEGFPHLTFLLRWKTVAKSTMDILSPKTTGKGFPEFTMPGELSGNINQPENIKVMARAMANCWVGGHFIHGSKVFDSPKMFDYGSRIIKTCRRIMTTVPGGLLPFRVTWTHEEIYKEPGLHGTIKSTRDDTRKFLYQMLEEKGFYYRPGENLPTGGWPGRPAFNGLYHAWRFTKDEKYRDWAWDSFLDMNKTYNIAGGSVYSPVESTADQDPRKWQLNTETDPAAWFSMPMTYLFLTFKEVRYIFALLMFFSLIASVGSRSAC
jgi:mannosyl-oligosaccharide alpha-1,2-mannosidase